ncbi:ATPase [Sphingomonas swuensis]|uniref:ATPase n=1 Tax=Sphingomonas swuensis TaxID=977800 RepID=A0ABP7SEW5_9SPHN
MKRFWKEVALEPEDGSWRVALDGRPVRTPARALLTLPTRDLGEAVAAEWRETGETIDPRAMPLTGLSNAAIDRVATAPDAFAEGLARYAASDLLCYRAEGPAKLVALQSEQWDPLLQWARRRYDVDFVVTQGVLPVDQSVETIAKLGQATAVLDPFTLAAMSPLVTIGGSLVAGLALVEQAITVDAAWEAVSLDDRWQLEQWGSDAEAEKALAAREADFRSGHRLLTLLG